MSINAPEEDFATEQSSTLVPNPPQIEVDTNPGPDGVPSIEAAEADRVYCQAAKTFTQVTVALQEVPTPPDTDPDTDGNGGYPDGYGWGV